MTLLMREAEIREEGRMEGREEGIRGMVSALKELGVPTQTILSKIQEKFSMSRENASRYL